MNRQSCFGRNVASSLAVALLVLIAGCGRNVLHPGTYVPAKPPTPPAPVPAHGDGTCDSGLVACGGAGAGYCFDLQAAPDHCGSCGNACPLGVPCDEGRCRLVPCTSQITVKVMPITSGAFVRNQVGLADFDRDGALDLGLIRSFFETGDGASFGPVDRAAVFRGQGDGTFLPVASYPIDPNTPPPSYALVAADLNRDEIPDLVFAAGSGQTMPSADQAIAMTVRLGRGDGTFGSAMDVVGGAIPTFIAVTDLTGDGTLDLVTTSSGNHAVTLWPGNGDGSFEAPQDIAVGGVPGSVQVTDWNGDGIPDLMAAGDYVHVLIGNGHGISAVEDCGLTLLSPLTPIGPDGPYVPAVLGDFDADGRVDLVANNTLMLGMEDCNFARQTMFHVPYDSAFPMAAADFNGDGKTDLAVAFDGGVGFLAGDGQGNLGALVYLGDLGDIHPTPTMTTGAAADFNGDGRLDLLVANQYGVRVFMNTCQ